MSSSLFVKQFNIRKVVSTCPLISKDSNLFTNSLRIVLCALNTIGITVIFMFHGFFSSLTRSRYLSIFSLSFIFTKWSTGTAKSTIISPRFGNPVLSQNPRKFCASHSPGQILDYVCTICSYILIQFPVGNLAHPVVSYLTLFLR